MSFVVFVLWEGYKKPGVAVENWNHRNTESHMSFFTRVPNLLPRHSSTTSKMTTSIPKTMRALTLPEEPPKDYFHPHSLSALSLKSDFPTPKPTATQALIRIHATSITPYELSWPYPPNQGPRITNHDIAGTVVSSATGRFKPGDRVYSLMSFYDNGGMAEYVAAEEKYFALAPMNVSDVEAASLPRSALTALGVVKMIEPFSGPPKRILITGGSGAVGRFVLQILKAKLEGLNWEVVVLGGKGIEDVEALGASVAVDYRATPNWEKEVGKMDLLLDLVGQKTLERAVPLLKDGGVIVTIGSPPIDWATLNGWPEATARGVTGDFFMVGPNAEGLKELTELVEAGKLKPTVALTVDGLTEEGVKDGWGQGLKGGLAGSVVVKIV